MKLCECGCGQPTKISQQNHRALGLKKGDPFRFLRGHGMRCRPDHEKFEAKLVYTGDCIVWAGYIDRGGYGQFCPTEQGRTKQAHRYAYEMRHGRIPEGLVLNHLCRNRACVNPSHLDPTTDYGNVMHHRSLSPSRINAQKTHCPQGHEYTADNTYMRRNGHRICATCAIARAVINKRRSRLESKRAQMTL